MMGVLQQSAAERGAEEAAGVPVMAIATLLVAIAIVGIALLFRHWQ